MCAQYVVSRSELNIVRRAGGEPSGAAGADPRSGRRQGYVAVEALALDLKVTPQTIRRDINDLCEQNLLQRYHGGAGLPSSVENLTYTDRQVMNLEAKQRSRGWWSGTSPTIRRCS